MQDELNFDAAQNARDAGMDMVEMGVHNVYAEWSEHALVYLGAYLETIGDKEFQSEDFKVWAVKEGLRVPINKSGATAWRVLGPLFLKARRQGLIRFVRIEATSGVTAHCANASVYVRA
jgi:hypothetical protein